MTDRPTGAKARKISRRRAKHLRNFGYGDPKPYDRIASQTAAAGDYLGAIADCADWRGDTLQCFGSAPKQSEVLHSLATAIRRLMAVAELASADGNDTAEALAESIAGNLAWVRLAIAADTATGEAAAPIGSRQRLRQLTAASQRLAEATEAT